jgi:hypothetical protein
MILSNAFAIEGQSGALEGLRPISANLFRMFFVKLPQNRHPERSASQIDRVVQGLVAAESKDPGGAYLTQAVRSFSTTEARQQDLLRYALDGHGLHLFMDCNHLPFPGVSKFLVFGPREKP